MSATVWDRAFCSSSLEMLASVVMKLSMVHMFGWIIPEPLHMPPICMVFPLKVNATAASFLTVSVVMIASAACMAASRSADRFSVRTGRPLLICSMGICCPITPVEAMRTEVSGIFKSLAASWAVFWQMSIPSCPVQALATPLLQTTAWTWGWSATRA